jgi:hypothetical protein
MRRFTAIIAVALVLASPVHGWAKGGANFGRSSNFVKAVPTLAEPESSPSSIWGGCGSRHHCDAHMYRFRGPADMGR